MGVTRRRGGDATRARSATLADRPPRFAPCPRTAPILTCRHVSQIPYAAEDYAYLTHDPRHTYWVPYTHARAHAGIAGVQTAALNVPIEVLELLVANMLLDGHPVW